MVYGADIRSSAGPHLSVSALQYSRKNIFNLRKVGYINREKYILNFYYVTIGISVSEQNEIELIYFIEFNIE